jgi:hypothetical protein
LKCDKSNWMNAIERIWTLHYWWLLTVKQNDLAESHAQCSFQQPTSCYCSTVVPMSCLCPAEHIVVAQLYGYSYLVYSWTVLTTRIFIPFPVICIFSVWIGLNLHLKFIGCFQCMYLGRFNISIENTRAYTLTLSVALWLTYHILIVHNHQVIILNSTENNP